MQLFEVSAKMLMCEKTVVTFTLEHEEAMSASSISMATESVWLRWSKNWVELEEHLEKRRGSQWWKSRRLVCTRVMPCSLQALITTWSAAEPAGAAMYFTPLYKQKQEEEATFVTAQQCSESLQAGVCKPCPVSFLTNVYTVRDYAFGKGVLYLPAWHDRCYLWRGRRHQSWQPRPAGSSPSSSSQCLTGARGPLHTLTSKLRGLGPVPTTDTSFTLKVSTVTWHWWAACTVGTINTDPREEIWWNPI